MPLLGSAVVPAVVAPVAPRRRDACPGVVDAMESADGWLLRIRLPGGTITPAQLRAVARVAGTEGSGLVEITSRANLQVRGVPAARLAPAAGALVDAGLALPDAALDARRAVLAPPLTGHDPTEAVDATALVAAVVAALVAADLPGRLPPKFSVAIDTGGALGLGDVPADVMLSHCLPAGVTEAALIGLVVAVARRCAELGQRAADLPPSVADRLLVDAATAGAILARGVSNGRGSTDARVGRFAHVDPQRVNLVAAPFLGRLDPGLLRAVADGAALSGGGAEAIRLTRHGGIAFLGVPRRSLADLDGQLDRCGLSSDPLDPRHGVSACIGSPGCAAALGDTTAEAATLVAARRSGRVGAPGGRVHVSGCEKHCGRPAGATTVLVGERS
jgi:precorrin-3B synthase